MRAFHNPGDYPIFVHSPVSQGEVAEIVAATEELRVEEAAREEEEEVVEMVASSGIGATPEEWSEEVRKWLTPEELIEESAEGGPLYTSTVICPSIQRPSVIQWAPPLNRSGSNLTFTFTMEGQDGSETRVIDVCDDDVEVSEVTFRFPLTVFSELSLLQVESGDDEVVIPNYKFSKKNKSKGARFRRLRRLHKASAEEFQ